jgi:hypothetical protein
VATGPILPFTTEILRQSARVSRSNALNPLAWLLGLLLSGTIGAVEFEAPDWLVITLGGLSLVTALLYLAAYVYYMIYDRDALRSERYLLGKLAINKGIIGDDLAGIIEVESSGTSVVPAGKGPDRK